MLWKTVIVSRNNKYVLVSCKLAIPFVCYSHLVYNVRTINIQTIEAAAENEWDDFLMYIHVYILNKKSLARNIFNFIFSKII
jgi:hypothetical protein